jgi:VirK protein
MHHTRLFKTMAILAVCACVQGISGTVMADEAQNAAALEHAVLCGKDIHAIFDLLRCTEHGTSKRGLAVQGSIHPDGFIIQRDLSVTRAYEEARRRGLVRPHNRLNLTTPAEMTPQPATIRKVSMVKPKH